MRLTYSSGPFSVAGAIEDGQSVKSNILYGDNQNEFGFAGQIKYSGDTFNGAIDGDWRKGNNGYHDNWQAGAGIGFALGDMANLSFGGAGGTDAGDNKWWGLSALASMNISDAVHTELGVGYKHYNNDYYNWGVLGGIYYMPVKQLTIGLEAEWNPSTYKDYNRNNYTQTGTYVDLVTVFAF